MSRMMMVGLAAAAMLCAALPQGQAANGAELTTAEVQALAQSYRDSAQPPAEEELDRIEPHLFPLLTVTDHPRALRADGRVIAWGSYPEITVQGDDYPVLARTLRNWSMEQKQKWESAEESMGESARKWMPPSPYYEYTVVDRWGRMDDQIVSFALRYEDYGGGAHPQHGIVTENIHVETGAPVAIDEIVTGRDVLLLALAQAYRTQYPGQEWKLFTQDIDTALEDYHDGGAWQETFCWMLDANNDLVVFYNPYEIGPYAAGSFELTVRRDVYPEVFRMDFEE